ncbi:GNAT family N-acetyltransferase [Allokutzneria sp. A3M-2-11 16]|uniref:GNAT family N-acetyltransferase n=1 Tax=Allokutzneria sp. A3M-2-11 16 TaxID=2962043 RepID=UPI0020B8D5AF|nr:GNAT family N-acetyltransferase [Allokutzneria sp. A3M-2-11 16]MCP3803388.1 GNAT family N-acetyltransferase [Allokutzneria sp. A3M-2-11 16]
MVVIRPARPSDLAPLVEIYNHYVEHALVPFDTEPASPESRTPWFESFSDTGPHRLLVAYSGQRVLGCAYSSPYRSHPAFAETVELGIYLAPGHRGQGVGSALYSSLLGRLSSAKVHLAVAAIALPNQASVGLHCKFGFTRVGVFDEYATKRGAYISSLWLQRRL